MESLPKRAVAYFRRFGIWRTLLHLALHGLAPSTQNKLFRGVAGGFRRLGIRRIPATVNGSWLWIDPRTPWTVREFLVHGEYEREDLDRMGSGELFVDVGANFG